MLKLKFQYFGHLMQSQFIGQAPDAGKDWRQEENVVEKMRRLDSITDSINMNLSEFQETVEDRGAWRAAVHGVAKSWTPLSE